MTSTDEPAERSTSVVVWVLFAVVLAVPWAGWLDGPNAARRRDGYTLFPLLGMWAWSIMWVHYAKGTLVRVMPGIGRSAAFDRLSGYLVLALLLAHPGLLVVNLWRDTGRAPPGSYLAFVGEGNEVHALLGTVSLGAFLAYEVLARLRRTPFLQRHGRWVGLAQIAAMVLVWVHGLGVGRHLEPGWLRHWWVLLGALALPCFAVVARADWTAARTAVRAAP